MDLYILYMHQRGISLNRIDADDKARFCTVE
jgi:hypothetical protein